MSSNKPARSRNYWMAASEELIKGREFAAQLEALLNDRSPANHVQASIMKEVKATISRALAALDYQVKTEESQYGGDDGKAVKRAKIESVQRGGYRRRRSHPCATKTIKSKSIEDGHAWRKYGQKEIHSTKFPRSYFRCTHKYDQDCKATRQVQQSEEDPSLFAITYFGEHTCRDPTEVLSSPCFQGEDAPLIIDFASHAKIAAAAAAAASCRRPQLSFRKQDCLGEVVSHNVPTPAPGSSLSDRLEFPDLGTMEGSVRLVEEFTGVVSENSVITSGFEQSPSGSLGWDFMEESFDFSDMLDFDGC